MQIEHCHSEPLTMMRMSTAAKARTARLSRRGRHAVEPEEIAQMNQDLDQRADGITRRSPVTKGCR